MAHLGSSFTSAQAFIDQADAVFMTDLVALNSSGVTGTAIASYTVEDDGSGYINVAVSASGLTAGAHVQHIHGTFDGDGNPTDAVTPTLADDADRDGLVEVLEGVPSYGDVLLPVQDADGTQPMADADGDLFYVRSFDIEDMSNFFSPVTMTQYSFDDVIDLALREYVIHGLDVPDGIGEGTGGEVDGGANGPTPILPVAAGEFEAADAGDAQAALAMAQSMASKTTKLGADDDSFDAGLGDDRVFGRGGDDMLLGGSGDDLLIGNMGDDTLDGGTGDDRLRGGKGDDDLLGGDGNDQLFGRRGNDLLVGGDGDDVLLANGGRDILGGGAGDDRLVGGQAKDEFHFDAGTGTDRILDFTQGFDVISLLDGGAVDFAASEEDGTRIGDSDFSADDFDFVNNVGRINAGNDQQVVYSDARFADLMTGTGAAVEAYVAASNGTNTRLVYDADWSTTEGREIVAVLEGISDNLTAADFDVY